MSPQIIIAGSSGERLTASLPHQRLPDTGPGEPDQAWLRAVALFRSVSRLRIELLCHGLLDDDTDPLADQLADLEARLATLHPRRWDALIPGLLAEEAGWWHSEVPQLPDPACRVCRRLRAGLTAEQLATIPVPVTVTGRTLAA